MFLTITLVLPLVVFSSYIFLINKYVILTILNNYIIFYISYEILIKLSFFYSLCLNKYNYLLDTPILNFINAYYDTIYFMSELNFSIIVNKVDMPIHKYLAYLMFFF